MKDEELLDDRFRTLLTDPKFKKPRKHDRKVKIDKRFQSMFKNDAFKVKYYVDKRGRPISKSTTEDFKKFYDLSSDEDETKNSSDEESESERSEDEFEPDSGKDEGKNNFPKLFDSEKDKKIITSDIRNKLMDMKVDYARGEGKLFSESSSDETETEESEDEDLYHEWNELDKDAEITNQITNRLAICNMDWDRIRAVDLMMLLNSFLPTGASVESVVIYPSEYGMKRMQEEEANGPAELVSAGKPISDSDSDEEGEEGKYFHMERMRKYQLNRLRYYYAIATFNTPETADFVYTNCNGVEYESSGIRLDLRFVDDDTTFDHEPKDICKSTDNYENYQPRFFTNTALQQAKVELTWDETDPKRLEFTQKINEAAKNGEINDSDLEDFVALTSSGEEDDDQESVNDGESFEAVMSDNDSQDSIEDDDPIMSYRKLLKEIEENEKADQENDEELEITWGSGDTKNTSVLKTKESTESKLNNDLTPFERLIEKKKQKSALKKMKSKQQNDDDVPSDEEIIKKDSKKKKKQKKKEGISEAEEKQKQELELLLLDENDENKHHFSLKKIKENESGKKKKKFKKKKENEKTTTDDFQVDVADERFSAIYTSHLFNIDPTNPKFHKTKGMEAFIKEKQKRIINNPSSNKVPSDEPAVKVPRTLDNISPELSSLVNSVKNKSKLFHLKKSKKRK